MIRRLYFILTLIAGVMIMMAQHALAQGQAVPTGQTFTLQQCIDYALENSIAAKNAAVDERIAQSKVRETIGIGLPQVSGSATITHNTKLQRFFQTKQVAGSFSGNDPNDPAFLPGVAGDDVVAAQNFFQLPSSGDASISVNQIIFNGSYIVGLQASKAYKDLAVKSTVQTKEQIIQQVTKAYYTVLINKERAKLFSSNIARVDTLLRNTRAMNKSGFAEQIDVDRIQVTLNNLITERDKFNNMDLLGIELLKFQMNYPMDQPLQVSGSILDIRIDSTAATGNEMNYKNRPDYQLLQANRKLQELNVRNQYAANVPSLSAFLNAGYMTQARNISGLFKTETDFSQVPDEQIRQSGLGTDKWYDYSMFGLKLTVPIFTGGQTAFKIQQQKLELLKINNNFRTLESSIDLEVKQTSLNFENALKTLQAQQQNMDLAGNVARITKIKYEQGVGSNLEVTDAEDSLRQAQTNYYSALFDAMVAKVDLDKAYGKLIPQTDSK